jgi:hypothetical protein
VRIVLRLDTVSKERARLWIIRSKQYMLKEARLLLETHPHCNFLNDDFPHFLKVLESVSNRVQNYRSCGLLDLFRQHVTPELHWSSGRAEIWVRMETRFKIWLAYHFCFVTRPDVVSRIAKSEPCFGGISNVLRKVWVHFVVVS